MHANADDITGRIRDRNDGAAAARDRVFTRRYAALKRLAAAVLCSESDRDTLQPTALLNDALIKLALAVRAPQADDRKHFARIVARAMRHAPCAMSQVLVLVDRARRKLADKRGAGEVPLSLDEHDAAPSANPADLIALDDAPGTLAQLDARAASVAELRVFAGLTIDETAQALDIHPSSMSREWAHASAWLKQHLGTAV